ncbi:MAG: hypothetical protein BGO10_08785 [Chlamydia sp. 32-24]|nr:MAG: hypothetical protein BGO10_08785 [Chlamydia sp. 32-24]
MTIIQALFLGIIQGLTEFLPVSSSGHLTLFQLIFGFKNLEKLVLFDIVCHLGTLLAILIVYSKSLKEMFLSRNSLLPMVFIAILPLFPLVLLLKPIKSLYNQTEYLGFFFLFTAICLQIGIKAANTFQLKSNKSQALFVGVSQALALMPGVSRSGITISTGKFFGMTPQQALTFSFLLAIPTILGASSLELFHAYKNKELFTTFIDPFCYLIGFITSFLVGFFSLKFLQKLADKQQFSYFVWYCLAVGFFTIIYTNYL